MYLRVRCGAFDGRVHVWDAAARGARPVAARSSAEGGRRRASCHDKRMLAPDPSKRPTFPSSLYNRHSHYRSRPGAGVSPFTH